MRNQHLSLQEQRILRHRRRQHDQVIAQSRTDPRTNIRLLLSLIGISMVLVLFVPNTLLMEEVLLICASPVLLLLYFLARATPADDSEGIALVPLIRRTKKEVEEQLRSYEVPAELLGVDCDICQDEYQNGETIAESPNVACVHRFHTGCIAEWLAANDECPICRRDYLKTAEEIQQEEDKLRAAQDDNVEVDTEGGVVGDEHCEPEQEESDAVLLDDDSSERLPLAAAAV